MTTNTTKALIKAKGCKAEAAYQMEILEHLGRNTEYSYERGIAFDAWSDAVAARRAILQKEWDLRRMERHVPNLLRVA